MKNIKSILLIATLGLFFFTACDNDFEETNTNPNDATIVPSSSLIADVSRNAGNILYSTFVGGDMGSCWSQQWAKVNYEEEARYQVRNSVIEATIWQGFYEDVIADAKSMEDIAIEEGNDYSRGAALILQAYGYHVMTDLFGMIPFTEAMDPSNLKPVYDSQEVVYAGILNMLDTANLLLTTGSGTINAATDLVYGGDHTGWLKFANSLKFRCLMRISGTSLHDAAALQEIASSRSIFTSNADEAKMVYLSESPNANPMYESIVYGSRFEYKVNQVLVEMLETLNDPRLPQYAEHNSEGVYRGKPSGINNVPSDEWNYDNVSPIGDYVLAGEWPAFFVSYSELMFLMAEAAQKGYISTGTAQSYYNAGVLSSLTTMGVEDQYSTYIAENGVAFTNVNALKQIAEQNWLGLYTQGIESWTEWRRTGYPALTPAIEAVVATIPSRFNYPPIEQSVNADSYNAAVADQGADLLTTDLWWMK